MVTTRSLELSIWVFFILLIQSVNVADFLSFTNLLLTFAFLSAAFYPVSGIVMVPFTSMYVSL